MTNDTRILSDADLEIVTGGANGPITLSGPSVVPHIPRDKDLLPPQMIQNLLSIGGGFNPPIPNG